MRIYNRKLASRISANKKHIRTLQTSSLSVEGIQAIRDIQREIDNDIRTLVANGYTMRGEKVRAVRPTLIVPTMNEEKYGEDEAFIPGDNSEECTCDEPQKKCPMHDSQFNEEEI